MGKEEIVARLLSDAEAEAAETVRAAQIRAEEILAAAKEQCGRERDGAEREAEARAVRIREGREATARLDGKKIRLAEKRRVLDAVYRRALEMLLCLDRSDAVALAERLLKENAEEGDEIVFSAGFLYGEDIERLPVFREKKLTVSGERPDLGGGFLLRGKTSDKDITYPALLAADRENHQAEIARAVFGTNR